MLTKTAHNSPALAGPSLVCSTPLFDHRYWVRDFWLQRGQLLKLAFREHMVLMAALVLMCCSHSTSALQTLPTQSQISTSPPGQKMLLVVLAKSLSEDTRSPCAGAKSWNHSLAAHRPVRGNDFKVRQEKSSILSIRLAWTATRSRKTLKHRFLIGNS